MSAKRTKRGGYAASSTRVGRNLASYEDSSDESEESYVRRTSDKHDSLAAAATSSSGSTLLLQQRRLKHICLLFGYVGTRYQGLQVYVCIVARAPQERRLMCVYVCALGIETL